MISYLFSISEPQKRRITAALQNASAYCSSQGRPRFGVRQYSAAFNATLKRCALAGAILLTTMPGRDIRVACEATRHHKFRRRDPAPRGSDARTMAEEIVPVPSFVRQRSHHARAPMLQQMRQSTRARPYPDDKQNLLRASRLDRAARIPVRRERASAI